MSFLSWLRKVFLGQASIRYSLSGGFGGNQIGLFAYYLSSPLNLLLLLFREETLPQGILLITLIKNGLMASSMQYYLSKKKDGLLTVPFSVMYAMSSFAVC